MQENENSRAQMCSPAARRFRIRAQNACLHFSQVKKEVVGVPVLIAETLGYYQFAPAGQSRKLFQHFIAELKETKVTTYNDTIIIALYSRYKPQGP